MLYVKSPRESVPPLKEEGRAKGQICDTVAQQQTTLVSMAACCCAGITKPSVLWDIKQDLDPGIAHKMCLYSTTASRHLFLLQRNLIFLAQLHSLALCLPFIWLKHGIENSVSVILLPDSSRTSHVPVCTNTACVKQSASLWQTILLPRAICLPCARHSLPAVSCGVQRLQPMMWFEDQTDTKLNLDQQTGTE